MAKKNNGVFQNVWFLLATASVLLSAGWLMMSFPILIFIGISPLFAISDLAKDKTSPWNHLEVILLSFTVSLFCARLFNTSLLMLVMTQAILLTLTFAGYSFAYHSLGNRLGKFTIIFLWLGLEYLMLKLPWKNDFLFLADALKLKPDWWKWNNEIGYLSISLWILVVNLFFFMAFFRSASINWFFVALAILLVVVPIIYSMNYLDSPGINREQMIALYNGNDGNFSKNYKDRGELITRSSAWVSVLIVLLAIVKNKVKTK